jgi:transglutaminase-like putative cysteine protease
MTLVSRVSIAGGDAGALDDLGIMCRLVNDSLHNPFVVMASRDLVVRAAPQRDTRRQAIAIRGWLARVWRFVDDPAGEELLRDPEHLLREYFATSQIIGDCDEAAILGAALGKTVGIPATFTVLAFDPVDSGSATFSHVFASLLLPDGSLFSLDVTKPPGSVPAPTRELTVDV